MTNIMVFVIRNMQTDTLRSAHTCLDKAKKVLKEAVHPIEERLSDDEWSVLCKSTQAVKMDIEEVWMEN